MSFILNPLNSVVPIGGVSTLTGNSGGAVGPSAGNINVVGTGDVLVAGNPGTNTLTISVTGGIPETFDADSGSATSSGGIININGAGTVSTSASGNTIVITGAVPPSFTWSVITTSQTAVVNNGYICNDSGTLALLLPATASVGNIIRVTGVNNATGWKITQNASQQIFFGAAATTSGTGGYIESSATYDAVELVCVVAGSSTIWQVISSIGNITVN